jgi:hypothetical protein
MSTATNKYTAIPNAKLRKDLKEMSRATVNGEIPIQSYGPGPDFEKLKPFKSVREAADSIGWEHQKFNYYTKYNRDKELKDCKAINGIIYKREDINVF